MKKLLSACALAVSLTGCAAHQRYDSLAMLSRIEALQDVELPPAPATTEGTTTGDWFTYLAEVAFHQGYDVTLVEKGIVLVDDKGVERKLLGLTTFEDKQIYLDAQLTPDGRVQTLAHELGHVFQPAELEWPDTDIFAEAVAFLVSGKLGLDTGFSSIGWLHPVESQTKRDLLRYGKQIDAVANLIAKEAQDARRAATARR